MKKPIHRARAVRRRLAEAAKRRAATPDTPAPDATQEALARVEALSRAARPMWVGLLAYLAFVVLTLFSVRDVDFFSLERAVALPLVNVAIPTETFFLGAPVLGAALHVYLHLNLLKLWDALAGLPMRDAEGCSIGDRIFPWLIGDWALRRRRDSSTTPRPLDWFADWVTFALAWLAAPAALFIFWWRSMPARNEWLTLAIAVTLLTAVIASWRSYSHAKAKLRKRDERRGAPLLRRMVYGVAAAFLAVASWARTEGGLEHYAHRLIEVWESRMGTVFVAQRGIDGDLRRTAEEVQDAWVRAQFPTVDDLRRVLWWLPLAPIDLRDADLARQPADWVSQDIARSTFRADWCRQHALPPVACHAPRREDFGGDELAFAAEQAAHRAAQQAWCKDTKRAAATCNAAFATLDSRFDAEWTERREGYLDTLSAPTMGSRDLRWADAAGAFFAGLDLRWARLEGADLAKARLEGADLTRAWLWRANLQEARLEGANLFEARLGRADLSGARLEEADLSRALLEEAILQRVELRAALLIGARLERADLSGARLEEADLSRALLEEAILQRVELRKALLIGARLQGADLGLARLEGADLSGSRLEGANLTEAQLEGANLSQARLERANLSKARLAKANLSEAWLEEVVLQQAELQEALLVRARLRGANLSEAQLEGANLSEARLDGQAVLTRARLQRANLRRALLRGANLSEAWLQNADLSGAQLEGANLLEARLEGANLSEARLEGANLFEARLEAANLSHARLERADLGGARLRDAYLGGARLDEAYFGGAWMKGAYLSAARLEDAYFGGTRLEGTNLTDVQAQSVDWAGATFGASLAHSADFTRGRNLTQHQLDDGPVIGNTGTILPLDAETGEQLIVWSCWETPPPNLDAMLEQAAFPFGDVEDLRAQWLCSDANPRRRTGTPAPE